MNDDDEDDDHDDDEDYDHDDNEDNYHDGNEDDGCDQRHHCPCRTQTVVPHSPRLPWIHNFHNFFIGDYNHIFDHDNQTFLVKPACSTPDSAKY